MVWKTPKEGFCVPPGAKRGEWVPDEDEEEEAVARRPPAFSHLSVSHVLLIVCIYFSKDIY